MGTFEITANGMQPSRYEATDEEAAILLYVQDAGYSTIEQAAEVCGQTVEAFIGDISVTKIA